jgi:hypothetical protein
MVSYNGYMLFLKTDIHTGKCIGTDAMYCVTSIKCIVKRGGGGMPRHSKWSFVFLQLWTILAQNIYETNKNLVLGFSFRLLVVQKCYRLSDKDSLLFLVDGELNNSRSTLYLDLQLSFIIWTLQTKSHLIVASQGRIYIHQMEAN